MELTVGSIINGKVTGIMKFGAFVSLGEKKSGLVHISEISNTYVEDVSTFLSVGQDVTVKIIGIDSDGKIKLSIKKANDQPPDQQRPVRPAPSKSSERVSDMTSLDDMLKQFMADSESNAAGKKNQYERRTQRKQKQRQYD